MSLFTKLYCSETKTFAVMEMRCYPLVAALSTEDSIHYRMEAVGTIEMRGENWYFVGTNAQVCNGFLRLGHTLQGEGTPERAADRVYKTARNFDEACKRMTQDTVATYLAQVQEIDSIVELHRGQGERSPQVFV